VWSFKAASAIDETRDVEEMTVGSPSALDHEFVSDSFQPGDINADDLKKEMDQLGVSDTKIVIDGTPCFIISICKNYM